ncbi:deoxyribose-phosphate aldolase [candidate division WOR-3 bacterium]|uniref:Deoxyribose-phosphate aldolase n=1 Tax=candidate division WOR-3 bacterium TaxID=2052148 RepID=A0A9D5QBP3_UNCW3|nr:deoxyribose-phosphate aldolase [candidate division WOR-3 bacterium]MBD3363689.1 deoxyribose-phosphate aldolase [candidate division WOR-3 bacterium]
MNKEDKQYSGGQSEGTGEVVPLRIASTAQLARIIDAAMLRPQATRTEVEVFLEEALLYNFGAVFLHPTWIGDARQIVKGTPVKLGIAIGYPHGAHLTETKLAEIDQGLEMGADEFDMVANIGRLRSGEHMSVAKELERCRRSVEDKIFKVIIETGWLSDEEKRLAAHIVADAGADFVKTSTGVTAPGATAPDVALLFEAIKGKTGVKASGGIRSLEQTLELVKAGATRIGTSSGRIIVEEAKKNL